MLEDFDREFEDDDEVSEAQNFLVMTLARDALEEDKRTQIINPFVMQHIAYTYKLLKYLTKGTGAKVTYKLHEPYKSMGFVTVSGKNIAIDKPEWFMKSLELASNFEVYPKADGTTEMNFTFHGLTKNIEED